MKVTSDNSAQLNPGRTIEKDSSRSDLDTLPGDDSEWDAAAEKTSFASVLDRVTQSHKDPEAEHPQVRSGAPRAVHDNKAKEKDNAEDTANLAAADRPLVPQPLPQTEMNPDVRAVMHTVDLEKIVAACRVQLSAAGRPEVIIDLTHSVLEGLRVKVSTDSAGRVATEFLAANEGIKSLLDERSADLLAMLRSRGLNVVNFRSSVAADASGGGDSRSGQNDEQKLDVVGQNQAARSAENSEFESAGAEELAIGATYRA